MDHLNVYFLLIILTFITHTTADKEYCFTGTGLDYCEFGCCGDGVIRNCCTLSIAAIVGLAIGGVLLLIFLISCICCIYCFYKNKKARTSGGVVNPGTNTNAVVVHNTNSAYSQPQPAFNQHPPPAYNPQPPPSYNQYNSFPSSNYSNPAFPPGSTAGTNPAFPPGSTAGTNPGPEFKY